jgi:hypothetical protein
MNLPQDDSTNRMRTILQRMERSIDDARSRRVEGTTPGSAFKSPISGLTSSRSDVPSRSMDPLDTRIADSVPVKAANSESTNTVRDAETMFDFEGPRLKARPKRPSSD